MSAAPAARGSGLLAATVLVVEWGGTSKPFEIGGHIVPPLHVYVPMFDTPPKLNGVVIRYDKGYVIAPGSRRPNGRAWRVRPEGLGAWATPDPETGGTKSVASAPASEGHRDVAIDLQAPQLNRDRAAVARIPNLAGTS